MKTISVKNIDALRRWAKQLKISRAKILLEMNWLSIEKCILSAEEWTALKMGYM